MRHYKNRSTLRSKISKYPMSQRKAIRKQLRKPSLNVSGKYSGLMRLKSVTGAKINKTKKPWYKRYKPGSKFKKRVKGVVKNKTVQKGVLTAATIGTVLAVMPKQLLNNLAETVQSAGENIFNIAEGMGDTAGSLIRAVGTGADAFSNGIGFLSNNFGTIASLGIGGYVLNKII